MREIGVDRRKISATLRGFQELPSHLDQEGGSAGCEIETPKEFLAPRFNSRRQLNGRLDSRIPLPGLDGGGETLVVRAEEGCQCFEKAEARIGGEVRELRQYVASECRIARPRAAIEWSRSAKKDVCMWRYPASEGVAETGARP
jgi:hypothetical protein